MSPSAVNVLKELENPSKIDRELESFRKAARALSSKHPRMIDNYPEQWVAVFRGKVQANAKTLEVLIRKIDKKNLPRDRVILRYIDKNLRTMIL